MSASVTSRDLILDRIRAATAQPLHPHAAQYSPSYIREGKLDEAGRIRLFIERLREYDAEVVECSERRLGNCINECLANSGRKVFVAPPGLTSEWITLKFAWKVDRKLSYADIEQCDGVVTTSSAGIADSGTIVLHHSPSEGRRALTLLPDWHLCIVRVNQLVETLPEYFARCTPPPTLATFISGPSATADIEMTRVKGVHGPRFLKVILVHGTIPGEPDLPEPSHEIKPERSAESELPPRPHRTWRPFDR